MTIKEQFKKIKDNWVIIVLVFVVLIFLTSGLGIVRNLGSFSDQMTVNSAQGMPYAGSSKSLGYAPSYNGGIIPQTQNFAPEVTNRKVVKDSQLSLQTKTGGFVEAQTNLKSIISQASGYILNENVFSYGEGRGKYTTGNYQIKVQKGNYDSVVAQLKKIGEVRSFNEQTTDITGQYEDLHVELTAEQNRLASYKQMLSEATNTADKLTLTDRIFDQERRVAYLDQALSNKDLQLEYSTISMTITEKQPEFYNLSFPSFLELIRGTLESTKALVSLFFVLIPWIVAGFVIWGLIKLSKRWF